MENYRALAGYTFVPTLQHVVNPALPSVGDRLAHVKQGAGAVFDVSPVWIGVSGAIYISSKITQVPRVLLPRKGQVYPGTGVDVRVGSMT